MVQQPHTDSGGTSEQNERAYEDASRSTADFIQNVAPLQEHKRKSRKRRRILIIVALIVVFGVGGYFLYSYLQRSPEKQPTQQTNSETNDNAESEEGFKTYSSTSLKFSFKYPENWQIHDDEQGIVRLESPVTSLPDMTGQQVDAKVVLSIVPTSADMTDFPNDKATGVRDSEKFAYDSPSTDQRQETFISFMNLSGASDGLNAAYITGDNSYVKGDPITKADFDKVEPVIWLEFHACPNQTCPTSPEKITIATDAWENDTTLQTAFTVLKSFKIK